MRNLTDAQKQRLIKAIKYLALAIATSIAMALGLTSCNVTRTITTESRSLTRGDSQCEVFDCLNEALFLCVS